MNEREVVKKLHCHGSIECPGRFSANTFAREKDEHRPDALPPCRQHVATGIGKFLRVIIRDQTSKARVHHPAKGFVAVLRKVHTVISTEPRR
jgi:hypothetical protein